MSLLETLKYCSTCVRGREYGSKCTFRIECLTSKIYKKGWVMCQSCRTCANKDSLSSDYTDVCTPCHTRGRNNWKAISGNLPNFEVPY